MWGRALLKQFQRRHSPLSIQIRDIDKQTSACTRLLHYSPTREVASLGSQLWMWRLREDPHPAWILPTLSPRPSLCSAPLRSPQLKHRLHCSPYEIRLSSPSQAFHCFSHTGSSILQIFYSIYIVFFLSSASFKNVLPRGGFSAHLTYYITEQEITLFHFLEIDNQI